MNKNQFFNNLLKKLIIKENYVMNLYSLYNILNKYKCL